MKLAGSTIIMLLLTSIAFAQTDYAVSSIPKNLLSKAGAVIRNEETTIEVKDLDNVSYQVHKAVTILNKAGEDEARIWIFYSKIEQIKSVKGVIYNEFGQAVSKFSQKDFSDISAADEGSLYEDSRVKTFKPALTSYPYTIAYDFEVKSKQSLYFQQWRPVNESEIAVERSVLQFSCPLSFNLRYKEFNYPGKAEESTGKDTKTYRWEVKNLEALHYEPYSPDLDQFVISVKLAPEKFAYNGIKGSFTNWNELGAWVCNSLLKDRDKIPENTAAYIRDLVKDIQDPKLKAKKIYEYMQNKCRYISVQIGIGGYRPYPSSEVDRLSYGDCKGLVNYMQSLLKIAGIKSYYTVVNAGPFKKDVTADFASLNQGNHVILCLPFANDTTWLECTSKKIPFGFLGDFTDDRLVLACTENGGKLMRTPKMTSEDNKQVRKGTFKLNNAGDLSGSVITQFEGVQYENHEELAGEPFTEQVKKLVEIYPIQNLAIRSFDYKQVKSSAPVATETLSFDSRSYSVISNGKIFVPLNSINKFTDVPREVRNRTNPLYINRGYYDEDEYTFELPTEFHVDTRPGNFSIEKPFGKYSAQIRIQGNLITYTRKMQLNEGNYPAEQYQEFVDFLQTVKETDNTSLVLTK